MMVVAKSLGGLPGTQVEGGLLLHQPDGPYFFDQQLQQQVAKLTRKIGVLLWQQALLAPANLLRLAVVNLDTQDEDPASQKSDADWDQILESLVLRPCQLQYLEHLYKEYASKVRTLRAKRCKLVSQLQQVHTRMTSTTLSAREHASVQLELAKLTSLIKQTCDAENIAYITAGCSIIRAMLFPLQKLQLQALSYPYYPQLRMIGEAVLRRLALQPPT